MAPDQNENGIPDHIDKVIGGLLLTADLALTAVVAATVKTYEWHVWVPMIHIVIPILAGYFLMTGRPGGNNK